MHTKLKVISIRCCCCCMKASVPWFPTSFAPILFLLTRTLLSLNKHCLLAWSLSQNHTLQFYATFCLQTSCAPYTFSPSPEPQTWMQNCVWTELFLPRNPRIRNMQDLGFFAKPLKSYDERSHWACTTPQPPLSSGHHLPSLVLLLSESPPLKISS